MILSPVIFKPVVNIRNQKQTFKPNPQQKPKLAPATGTQKKKPTKKLASASSEIKTSSHAHILSLCDKVTLREITINK